MIGEYRKVKDSLPKGTLSPKKIGNQTYYYLKYRDGDRIVSDYVHKEDLENLTELIEHRKHTDVMIRSLKDELKKAKSLLKSR